jgi:hypothetical protein
MRRRETLKRGALAMAQFLLLVRSNGARAKLHPDSQACRRAQARPRRDQGAERSGVGSAASDASFSEVIGGAAAPPEPRLARAPIGGPRPPRARAW